MRWVKGTAAFACIVLTPDLFAEPVAAMHSGRFGQLGWNWDPWILASLSLAVAAYVCGLWRIPEAARSRVFGKWRYAAFGAAIAALFAVLISPLDALDDELFTAHMLQHLVLMMVAPPLLIMGRLGTAFLWAFPLRIRRWIARAWVFTGLRDGVHAVMSPVAVWILGSAALWFWHLPGPYGWALSNEWVHAFEHICFFVTSLMFWALVVEPLGRRRLDYGIAMLFVTTFGMQNGLLGAILTFGGRPLYVAYLPTTAAWGLTPLEDQQLAGLIMWIPASLIHLATLGFLFVAWMRGAERREAASTTAIRSRSSSQAPAVRGVWIIFILFVGITGCDRRLPSSPWKLEGANASRGPALMEVYGCGACHTIPGVPRAIGRVGPPLGEFGQRAFVAGMLRNNPENLVKWLREPQSIVPGNAMLDMGVTEQDARDLAAYLYALPTGTPAR
ncbi:MAG: cytochrome c oxidase assembly protein [Bryobacteraceae bacterium]